jgi:hypothetical protein
MGFHDYTGDYQTYFSKLTNLRQQAYGIDVLTAGEKGPERSSCSGFS